MDIKIIDISVNIDHVHLFFQYPPRYSVSFIAKKNKGKIDKDIKKKLSTSQRMVRRSSMESGLLSRFGWTGLGSC